MQRVGDVKWLDDRIAEQKANILYYERMIEEAREDIVALEKKRDEAIRQ
jgi:hypothetical protein